MKTAKKRQSPDFVTSRLEFNGKKMVRRYYAGYDGGYRLVRITKKQHDKRVALNEKVAMELLERKQGGKRGAGTIPGAGHCWPLRCEALACHPSQVEGFKAAYKKRGVNVEVLKSGIVVVPDEGAYRRLRKVHGAFHRNSYNG